MTLKLSFSKVVSGICYVSTYEGVRHILDKNGVTNPKIKSSGNLKLILFILLKLHFKNINLNFHFRRTILQYEFMKTDIFINDSLIDIYLLSPCFTSLSSCFLVDFP